MRPKLKLYQYHLSVVLSKYIPCAYMSGGGISLVETSWLYNLRTGLPFRSTKKLTCTVAHMRIYTH